jgi:hypothetical protein
MAERPSSLAAPDAVAPVCKLTLHLFSVRADVIQRIAQPSGWFTASVVMNITVLTILLGLSQPVADIPTIEVTPHVQTPTANAGRAVEFIESYFQHFSTSDVISRFEQDYAAYIDYYGKVVNRDTLMREKAHFVQRWPQRDYRPRQNSITVSCINGQENLCLITGLVDFECRSSERHAASNGVARFKAAILFEGEEPRIVGEDSEVLE